MQGTDRYNIKNFEIKAFKPEHIPDFKRFRHDLTDENEFYRPTIMTVSEEDIRNVLLDKNKRQFLVWFEGIVVGHCRLWILPDGQSANYGNGLLLKYQGMGVGKRMFKFMMSYCRKHGIRSMEGIVDRMNWRALLIDYRMGMRVVGEHGNNLIVKMNL